MKLGGHLHRLHLTLGWGQERIIAASELRPLDGDSIQ
jgi:hypothetical protein